MNVLIFYNITVFSVYNQINAGLMSIRHNAA